MNKEWSDADGNSASRQDCQIDWCQKIIAHVQKYCMALHLIGIDEWAENLDPPL